MDDAKETQITEVEGDKWVSAPLDYKGIVLEGTTRFSQAKLYRRKLKTGNFFSRDYREFPRIVRGQQNMSHFLFKCTKFAYLRRKS